ncbi:MAG TPA: glycosyltransferase [Levilinea sp.]|nr:glycosyltransferase [Levilinea sp.]
MPGTTPYLTIVIPAYNEAEAIRAGKLGRVSTWLSAQDYNAELIVVDDGSQDETAALAEAEGVRVERITHAGKAAAIVAGIQAARGDIILFTDMDQATPIFEAERLLHSIKTESSIAIGSRGLIRPGAPAGRYVLSWGQILLRYILLGIRISDTQCGFKAFTRLAAQEVLQFLHVYHPARQGAIHGPSVTSGFDVEFLMVANRLGYRISEVPVRWNYQETRRVSLVKDAMRGMRDLVRIAWARLLRQYPRRRRGRLTGSRQSE